jgi:DNA-directed RNA polymerase subunit omega
MARITVEDCLQKVNNRFTVIHMASQRVRQLRKGAEPSIVSKNRDVVISLREIAAGTIKKAELTQNIHLLEEHSDVLPEEAEASTIEETEETPKEQGNEEVKTEDE